MWMSNWKRKTENRERHRLTQGNRESARKKGKLEDCLQEMGTETLLHPALGSWGMKHDVSSQIQPQGVQVCPGHSRPLAV